MVLERELLLEKCDNIPLNRSATECIEISEYIDAKFQYPNSINKSFFTYIPHGKGLFKNKGKIKKAKLRTRISAEMINDIQAYPNIDASMEMGNLLHEHLITETIQLICCEIKRVCASKSLLIEFKDKNYNKKIKDGSFKKIKRFLTVNKNRFNPEKDAVLMPPEMLYLLEDSYFRFQDNYEIGNEFVNIGEHQQAHGIKYGMCTELFATFGNMKIFNHPYLTKDDMVYIKNYKDIEFFKEVTPEVGVMEFSESYVLNYFVNIPNSVKFGVIREW